METKFALHEILGKRIAEIRHLDPKDLVQFWQLGPAYGIELEDGGLVFPLRMPWRGPMLAAILSDMELTILDHDTIGRMHYARGKITERKAGRK